MIAFVDIKNQNILLYGKDGLITIPFDEANSVVDHIGAGKITYVTKAMQVSALEIVELINSLGIKTKPVQPISNNKYLHGTLDGPIVVKSGLRFDGKYDCKLIDADMKKIIMETPLLQTLINKNKIEIISEASRSRLLKGLREDQQKQLNMQKKKDDHLGSIIMDTKVSDWDGTISGEDHDSAIPIDLTGDVKAGDQPGMEDLMAQIEGG